MHENFLSSGQLEPTIASPSRSPWRLFILNINIVTIAQTLHNINQERQRWCWISCKQDTLKLYGGRILSGNGVMAILHKFNWLQCNRFSRHLDWIRLRPMGGIKLSWPGQELSRGLHPCTQSQVSLSWIQWPWSWLELCKPWEVDLDYKSWYDDFGLYNYKPLACDCITCNLDDHRSSFLSGIDNDFFLL